MSCKRVSTKARREQGYWISFSGHKDVTEEERLDFYRYDSHGGEPPLERVVRQQLPFGEDYYSINPIMLGKKQHGMIGNTKGGKRGGLMIDWYFDEVGWIGGLYMVEDFLTREPFGLRPLREWFGDEMVQRWLAAFLFHAFGWPDLVMREKYARTDLQ